MLNIGGGASKLKLVADLKLAYTSLNQTLERTKQLSADIAANMERANGGGGSSGPGASMDFAHAAANTPKPSGGAMSFEGAAAAAPSMVHAQSGPGGYQTPGTIPSGGSTSTGYRQPSGGGGSMSFEASSKLGKIGLGLAAGAAQATDAGDYMSIDLMTRRAGFYAGRGGLGGRDYGPLGIDAFPGMFGSNSILGDRKPGDARNNGRTFGSMTFQNMMDQGTAINPLDAAEAAMSGNSRGLSTGLSNYSTVAGSAATLSNLAPGAGLTGGMQATAALNGARNVNMLRMIGINVRDDKTGLMKSFEDIANQLWDFLKRNKRDGGTPTAQEISLALQPGNSLDLMLNQYFSGDPVLREGVVAALMQKAAGGNFSKSSLAETGALPESAQATGKRNAVIYRGKDLKTDWGVQGVERGMDLNNTLNAINQGLNQITGPLTSIATFLQTVAGGGNGGVGTFFGSLFSALMPGSGGGGEAPMGGGESTMGQGGGQGGGAVAPINDYSKHITSHYGPRKWNLDAAGNKVPAKGTRTHKGMDIGVAKGTAIHAAKDGKVVHIGANMSKQNGFGHSVTIQHEDGYQTLYGHMMETPNVRQGDQVSAGDIIGKVGSTGASTGPHLHFQLQKGGETYDPEPWLSGAAESSGSATSGAESSSTVDASGLFGSSVTNSGLFGNAWDSTSNSGRSSGSSGGGAGGGMGDGGMAMSATPSVSVGSKGTTVHIHVQGGSFNEERLAREVKRVLDEQELVRMAVIR